MLSMWDNTSDAPTPGANHIALYMKGGALYARYSNGTVAPVAGGVGAPTGGSTGQVLAKASGTDYDFTWSNPLANPMSAVADIIVGGTAGALTRLAKGTGLQLLRMNSGATAQEWHTLTAGDLGALTAETDPVFSASAAAGVTLTDLTNWDSAYGWGDHASAGYQPGNVKLSSIASLANAAGVLTNDGAGNFSYTTPSGGVTSVFGKTGAVANISDATGWLKNNGSGTFSWSTPTASDVGAIPTGGAVLSVTAGDTTLTAGGTATNPTLKINLANANTWTAKQTITMPSWDYGLLVNGGSISAGEVGVTNGTVIGYNTSAGAGWFGTNSPGSLNVFTLANMNAAAAASANLAAYINGANTSQLRFGRSSAVGTVVLANTDAGGTLITHTTFDAGGITNAQLAGSGTRMVTASSTGLLATAAIPSLTGYVPYTGATSNVDLGTFNLTAASVRGGTTNYAFVEENALRFARDGDSYIKGGGVNAAILIRPDGTNTRWTMTDSAVVQSIPLVVNSQNGMTINAGDTVGGLSIYRASSSNGAIGRLSWQGNDSLGNLLTYARAYGTAEVSTDGAEMGAWYLATAYNGTITDHLASHALDMRFEVLGLSTTTRASAMPPIIRLNDRSSFGDWVAGDPQGSFQFYISDTSTYGAGRVGSEIAAVQAGTATTAKNKLVHRVRFYTAGSNLLDAFSYQATSATATSMEIGTAGTDALTIRSATTLAALATGGVDQYLAVDTAGLVKTIAIPSLTGYVPYTGATASLVMGSFDLKTSSSVLVGTGTSSTLDNVRITPTQVSINQASGADNCNGTISANATSGYVDYTAQGSLGIGHQFNRYLKISSASATKLSAVVVPTGSNIATASDAGTVSVTSGTDTVHGSRVALSPDAFELRTNTDTSVAYRKVVADATGVSMYTVVGSTPVSGMYSTTTSAYMTVGTKTITVDAQGVKPTASAGIDNTKVLSLDANGAIQQGTISVGGGSDWLVKTTGYTCANRDRVLANTTSAAVNLTLPATPSAGNYVQFGNGGGWDTNAVTILRNGSTIMGLAEDMTVDTNTPGFSLVYNGTTWRITP